MPDPIRILLVDDDKMIVQATGIRLQAHGYQVCKAHDGAEGVRIAQSEQPDLIVLDIRMPVMDGMEALALLQQGEKTRDIPVIMLSASVVEQNNAIAQGARYFLEKPFEAKNLLAAIEAATCHSAKGKHS